ncbi:MAG: hypothetical protein R3F05_00175 [Planctomycetota bacterium]
MGTPARWVLPGLALLLLGVGVFIALREGASTPAVPVAPVPLEISHRTTRITEPLAPDGLVDYVAALNTGEPPPPGENAVVALLGVLGTNALSGDAQTTLERLRAPADVPAEGIFRDRRFEVAAVDELASADEELVRETAAWLAESEAALDALVRASSLPRAWSPVVMDPETQFICRALDLSGIMPLVDALALRAELRRVQGQPEAGWLDARALFAWHELASQQPGMMARLEGCSAFGQGFEWLKRALEDGTISPELAREALLVVQRPWPADRLAQDIDVYDRLSLLGMYVAQVSVRLGSDGQMPREHEAYVALNPALQSINEAFDEVAVLLATPSPSNDAEVLRLAEERMARVRDLSAKLQGRGSDFWELADSAQRGGQLVGRKVGEVLASTLLAMLPSVVGICRGARDKASVVALGLALHLYDLEHGGLPDHVGLLVPEYVADVPVSARTGEPVTYERTPSGCRVRSGEAEIELVRPLPGR